MDISALQQFIQLQALAQMNGTTSTNNTNNTSTDFSAILWQVMNTLNNSNSTLGSTAGFQNQTASPLTLNTLGGLNVNANQNIATNLYSNYRNTYTENAEKTNTIKPVSSDTGKKTDYDAVIKKASETYGIPEKMIKAVIQQESGFNPNVSSHVGASGLMQLMPATARSLGVTDIYDPAQNIMAGTKYLKQMLNQFGDYTTMLAAYNAGPGNVSKYGGIPPFNETQNYVKKVMANYQA